MPAEEGVVDGDTRSLLLETLAAQAGGGGGINVPELLLSRLGGAENDADPSVGAIARYLAQARAEQEEDDSFEDEDEDLLGYPSELERARGGAGRGFPAAPGDYGATVRGARGASGEERHPCRGAWGLPPVLGGGPRMRALRRRGSSRVLDAG